MFLAEGFQDDHGDFTCGFFLVFSKILHLIGYDGIETAALFACNRDGFGLEATLTYLNFDLWISDKIVIPIGISGRAPFGGDDKNALAIFSVNDGCYAGLTTFGSGGSQEQEGSTLEWATHFATISADLLNNLLVEITWTTHMFSYKLCSLGVLSPL